MGKTRNYWKNKLATGQCKAGSKATEGQGAERGQGREQGVSERSEEEVALETGYAAGQEIGYIADKQIKETSKANANNCTTQNYNKNRQESVRAGERES